MSCWKSSIQRVFAIRFLFKLIYKELLIYLIAYFIINTIYRYALNLEQQMTFTQIVRYFEEHLDYYGRDLTFLLGFYVSLAAKRWWDQYQSLPWPDQLAVILTGEHLLFSSCQSQYLYYGSFPTTKMHNFHFNKNAVMHIYNFCQCLTVIPGLVQGGIFSEI